MTIAIKVLRDYDSDDEIDKYICKNMEKIPLKNNGKLDQLHYMDEECQNIENHIGTGIYENIYGDIDKYLC